MSQTRSGWVYDPQTVAEMMPELTSLGAYHIRNLDHTVDKSRMYRAFVKRMVADLGIGILPYLRKVYWQALELVVKTYNDERSQSSAIKSKHTDTVKVLDVPDTSTIPINAATFLNPQEEPPMPRSNLSMPFRVFWSVVAFALLMCFVIFVFPTRYRYERPPSNKAYSMIRIDRITGEADLLYFNEGWRRAAPPIQNAKP